MKSTFAWLQFKFYLFPHIIIVSYFRHCTCSHILISKSTIDVRILLTDATYYANWLSIVYGLKDRQLKNLLVFSSKIADLTLFFVAYLKTEGKWGKSLSFAPKPPLRKDKAYRGLFRRFGLQNQRWAHGFWGLFLWNLKVRIPDYLQPKRKSADMVQYGFGEAISYSPLLALL